MAVSNHRWEHTTARRHAHAQNPFAGASYLILFLWTAASQTYLSHSQDGRCVQSKPHPRSAAGSACPKHQSVRGYDSISKLSFQRHKGYDAVLPAFLFLLGLKYTRILREPADAAIVSEKEGVYAQSQRRSHVARRSGSRIKRSEATAIHGLAAYRSLTKNECRKCRVCQADLSR